MPSTNRLNGWRWGKLVEWARRELFPRCWVCAELIDMRLPYNDPESWTLDHVLPRKTHPHLTYEPGNLRPAHRRCNSRKGAGGLPEKPRTSRHWGG